MNIPTLLKSSVNNAHGESVALFPCANGQQFALYAHALILSIFLSWLSPAHAQDVGLFFAVDCTTEISPVTNRTACFQSGGTAGLYFYDGSWILIVASGGEAPSTADYVVGTADGGLSAERVATNSSRITIALAAGQITWDVAANSITATHVDETSNYVFTGTVLTSTTVASLGTATAGVAKWVTDANTTCTAGGGSTIRLCRGNGTTWDTIGDGSPAEVDTLDTVFDRGKTIDGANSLANAVRIGGATDSVRWCLYNDATLGRRFLPCEAANTQTIAMTNQTWCLFDEEGGVCGWTWDPDALGAASGTLTARTGDQLVASNLGVEFAESDTNPPCAAGNYNIYSDLSETTLKKCVNGTATDLAPAGVGASVLVASNRGSNFACTDPGPTTTFLSLGNSTFATQADAAFPLPRAGTLKRLHVSTAEGTVPAGETVTVHTVVAGTAGSLTCQIAAAGSSCNDTTNSHAVTTGQSLSVRVQCGGGVTAIANVYVTMVFE